MTPDAPRDALPAPAMRAAGHWTATLGRAEVCVWFSWRVFALGVGVVVTDDVVECTVGLPFVHAYVDMQRRVRS